MPETASTLAAWRIGGQIDESALTGISQYADIEVTATLIGATGQNVVDPTNQAFDLRGPYVTIVGGVPGTATTKPLPDGNATLAGRLWWTEPLKATGAVDPNAALQPSGLAWQIVVKTTTRRGDVHTLATFTVGIEGDRDYTAAGETILVPSGTGGADEAAIGVGYLTEPPATVVNNTFGGRVLDVLDAAGISAELELPVGGTAGQALVKATGTDYDVTWDTVAGVTGLPVGGTAGQALVKNSGTDFDVEWSTVGGGSGTLPAGWIDGSAFLNPNKYALWNGVNGSASMTSADSTADFQALFDHVGVLAYQMHFSTSRKGNLVVLMPRGRFLMLGTCTIPNTNGLAMMVEATGLEIIHKPQGGIGIPMFQTALPTSGPTAEAANNVRNLWTWRGGFYDGDRITGEHGFVLNAVSRMVMERMVIQSFDEGIRGRFVLHFNLRDSMISQCTTYGLRIEATNSDDAWAGASPANAASNGTLIQNVRFYGHPSNLAQCRIAHSGHTLENCTFEGGSPGGHNYEFYNLNTSVRTSTIRNVWMENDAVQGHFMVNTSTDFDIDIQYSNSDAPIGDFRQGNITVRRAPWPAHSGLYPIYKVNGLSSIGTGVKVKFVGSGRNGGDVDPSKEGLWVDRVFPEKVAAYEVLQGSGNPKMYMSGGGEGGASRKQIWSIQPPGNATPGQGGTSTAAWVLEHQPAAPTNSVAPSASGAATVGSSLTSTTGTWSGAPTPAFSYQWNRDGVPIAGATASTYLLASADIGATITCTVTATNYTWTVNAVAVVSNGIGPIA